MKRVVQADETGCGIACIATIAGMTYQEVKAVFLQEIFNKKKSNYSGI